MLHELQVSPYGWWEQELFPILYEVWDCFLCFFWVVLSLASSSVLTPMFSPTQLKFCWGCLHIAQVLPLHSILLHSILPCEF